MTPSKVVEDIIKAAISRGEFDDLPGKGKPVDLTDYFNTPEESRVAYSLLKNAGILPTEIESLKSINSLKEELRNCKDEQRKSALSKKLNELQLSFDISIDKYKK